MAMVRVGVRCWVLVCVLSFPSCETENWLPHTELFVCLGPALKSALHPTQLPQHGTYISGAALGLAP